MKFEGPEPWVTLLASICVRLGNVRLFCDFLRYLPTSSSWNFPARAELGNFNFRVDKSSKILTLIIYFNQIFQFCAFMIIITSNSDQIQDHFYKSTRNLISKESNSHSLIFWRAKIALCYMTQIDRIVLDKFRLV